MDSDSTESIHVSTVVRKSYVRVRDVLSGILGACSPAATSTNHAELVPAGPRCSPRAPQNGL